MTATGFPHCGVSTYCHSARNGWEEEQSSVSWEKLRAKSGGHLYHHIHELDCIQYGHPGKKPPLWLHGIMKNEMKFFNSIMHGEPVPDEFKPLLNGRAARAAIATADAAALSLRENRKVKVGEGVG